MIHLFINGLAASAGGGLTYIRNVIPQLAATPDLKLTVALGPGLEKEFVSSDRLEFLALDVPTPRRFWYEQSRLPSLIRRSGADVLLSAGNFALRKSPVPQILLSRNSIYTSPDYYRDLRRRNEYGLWLETRLRGLLAKKSIDWADITVAPSEAFAAELRRWTGAEIQAIHHGFDCEAFTRDPTALPAQVEEKLRAAEGSIKLLFVSHYNYYRNFETLIRALPLLRDRCGGRAVKLLLTCKLAAGENPGSYHPEAAAKLVRELGVRGEVVELGAIRYAQLHQLYRRADIYVTPAYTETFAHPLVEAMASGLPVVASDLPVHREICGDGAVYFPRFSPQRLSERVAQLALSPEMSSRIALNGVGRAQQFSWKMHTGKILQLAGTLKDARALRRQA